MIARVTTDLGARAVLWASGTFRHGSQTDGFVFEVNPLILQIVLRNEAEILDLRPELTGLDHPRRVAEICKELFFVMLLR